ncbi:polymerase delta-interacting protein 3 [Cricetulus griseus]|nr:polymerase delta-interacting protein 3 [Cricetulus griseus]
MPLVSVPGIVFKKDCRKLQPLLIQEMEERISVVEDSLEDIQSSTKENLKSNKSLTQNFQEIRDTVKRPNLRLTGREEGEEIQIKGTENIFNKIIEENVPNLQKDVPMKVQEAYRCSVRWLSSQLDELIWMLGTATRGQISARPGIEGIRSRVGIQHSLLSQLACTVTFQQRFDAGRRLASQMLGSSWVSKMPGRNFYRKMLGFRSKEKYRMPERC